MLAAILVTITFAGYPRFSWTLVVRMSRLTSRTMPDHASTGFCIARASAPGCCLARSITLDDVSRTMSAGIPYALPEGH